MKQSLLWILAAVLLSAIPAHAGDFECADPNDLDPGTTDLVVTKEASATEAAPGDEITYTIQVHNCGPIAALDVEFTDLLPLRVIVTSLTQISGPTTVLSPPPINRKIINEDPQWGGTIDVLPANETAVYELVVLVDHL